MKSLILIILCIYMWTFAFAQQDCSNIATWKPYTIPTNPDTLMKYNASNLDWHIKKERNNICAKLSQNENADKKLPFELKPLTATEKQEMNGDISYVEVDSGYLVSFYKGEFGGSLYWFDKTGEKRKRIARTMILQFIKRNGMLYAIGGLAHMGLLYGGLEVVKKENNDWKLISYFNFNDAPYAIDIDNKNKFIVITSNHLLAIDESKNVDTLIANGFWNMLYPTSMTVDKNHVFVGMRQGVFQFNLLTKKEEWLMRD